MTAIIFVGPTLPPAARPYDSRLHWLPPVRQGDLYRAALTKPQIIGVVDGYFEIEPTVWHKEILWAMTQGIHVFGSASVGALRAAELDIFGMRGIGQVYEAFRDGVLEDDDEVAVLHGPEELGYPPVTEAMINLRATIEAAVEHGVIDAALAGSLIETGKALFYKERTYATIFNEAARLGTPVDRLEVLIAWLPHGRVDRKRLDAMAMIEAIVAQLDIAPPPLQVAYTFAVSAAWRATRERIERELAGSPVIDRQGDP
jgi:hypothetical protein